MKELEALVLTMKATMDQYSVQNLSDRLDRAVEGFTAEVESLKMGSMSQAERMDTLQTGQDWLRSAMHGVQTGLEDAQQKIVKLDLEVETIAVLRATVDEMAPTLEHVRTLVESTNKSAPSKRNMTDADAMRVLTGDMKDEAHKEAAEKIGLTYAQVYSCRGEFTFKHVHKELRDSGWKNPFKKPEPQHK
jgi:hypothetical protein